MLYKCYSTWANDRTRNQLFQLSQTCGGWISDRRFYMRVYVREDLETLVLLIDPCARRLRSDDYLV